MKQNTTVIYYNGVHTPVCTVFQARCRQRKNYYFRPSGQGLRSLHDFFLLSAAGAADLFVVVLESTHGEMRR